MNKFRIDRGCLLKYMGDDSNVVVPNGITHIRQWAFDNCESLQSITIPDSLDGLNGGTFYCCKKLKSIIAPKTAVEKIFSDKEQRFAIFGYLQNRELFFDAEIACSYKKHAIKQHTKLLPIIFDNDSAEALAFYAEEKIITDDKFEEEYFIPAIMANAKECVEFLLNWQSEKMEGKLKEEAYIFRKIKKRWSYENSRDHTFCLFSYRGSNNFVFSVKAEKDTNKIKEILENIRKIESVFLSDNLTAIHVRTFYNCQGLQSITIPDGVVSIGNYAFADCKSLQSIILPDSVTSIGEYTFHGCERLQNIIIPDGVITVGNHAFADCKSLQSIILPDSVMSIGQRIFFRCESLQSVTISNSIRNIGIESFFECKSLQSIVIPNSVSSIEYNAFNDCKNLQSIVISDNITSIDYSVFFGCYRLQNITASNLSVKNFIFDNLKCAATLGYLKNRKLYLNAKIAKSYKKYALKHRKELLSAIFENDAVEALAFYVEEKKINAKNFEKEYLEPATKAHVGDVFTIPPIGAQKCKKFLLDWKKELIQKKNRRLK